jgi:hypothetical protein
MEVIYSYTRKQAIEDGVLHDLSELAWEAGFRVPVAATEAVWQRCIAVPAGVPWQDETGRAWDILMVMFVAAKVCLDARLLQFKVFVMNEPHHGEDVTLKAIIGPGDNLEPVITVMFPEED